ncbi:hypothetical protein [Archaeoglobus sp.]
MKRVIVVLCICIALFLVVIASWYLGSENKSYEFTIQTELKKVKLSTLWIAVTKSVDLQNSTANLEWLYLKASDGKIRSLHLEFTGKNSQGESRIYYMNVNPSGLVNIYSKSIGDIQCTTHPMHIFARLDEFGLENIGSDYTLDTSFEWGDLGFNSSYGNLYLLKDGKLIPLEKVTFHVNSPICRILVCKDTCEVWFTQDDLLKAEEVVLKRNRFFA